MTDHATAVRQLARTIHQLTTVNIPELARSDEMIFEESHGDDWYDLEQDDDWWASWCEVYDIVEAVMGSANVGDTNIRPDVESHRQYDEITAKTDYTSLVVKVYADGDLGVLAEYDRGNSASWDVLFEGRLSNETPNPIDLGRAVASAELAHIASETESCAETLDYWQTKQAPQSFSQRRWGDVRGVGRQTVSDRVRSASTAMIRDYSPSKLHDALNEVESADVLDFAFITRESDNVTGEGVFRVSEVLEPFGDGHGHIRCENDVDDVITDIKEMERESDERVAIEQDGELTHIGGYVTIK